MTAELLRLEVKTTCNTPDEEIVRNIRASRDRPGTKWLAEPGPVKDRTLLIVGSGPSAWAALAQLELGDYDVMALNGAYGALLDAGYAAPMYYAQLDARAFNLPFLRKTSHGTKYLLAAQVHPDIFDALAGHDVTTFHLNTETEQQVFGGTEGLFLGSAGGTIGTTAIALGGLLGYRHIIVIGYDSSFGPAGSHMVPQSQNAKQPTIEVEFDGKWYTTTATMAGQVNEYLDWLNALQNTWPGLAVDHIGEGLLYDYVQAAVLHSAIAQAPVSREEELAKYDVIYNSDPEYRSTQKRLAGVRRALESVYAPNLSYLDVSCGRGETLDLARSVGFESVSGTETVRSLVESRADVTEAVLPDTRLPGKCADVVSLIEVIEHLVPDDVEPALRELERLARKYIIISAATSPSFHNFVSLHPSARPEREWDALLRKTYPSAEVARLPYDFHPSPAWIITL
jgi:hypothetical protein